MNAFLVLFVALAALGSYMWRRRRLYYLSWQLNGPIGYPIIGTAYIFRDATKVVDSMADFGERYGNMNKLWLGNRLFVYIDNPETTESILNSPMCINKGESYKYIEEFIGGGLVTSRGEQWRTHRKMLNPSFSYNVTNKFVPIFNKHIRTLMQRLQNFSNGETFNIHAILKNCSMDLICETSMGRVMNSQSGENKEYMNAIHNVLEIAGVRMFNPVLQQESFFHMSNYYNDQQKSIKICHQVVTDIIDAKSITIKEGQLDTKQREEDKFFGKEKHIFIDRVLKLVFEDKAFTIKDALNETNTILLAGYETTATSLSFIMLMLAMHPEHQERVHEECKSVIFTEEEDITTEQLSHLKYLDMFIKETMRIFPAVPYLTRKTTGDFEVDGVIVPPGVEFVISCIAMHRSEKHFNNPTVFDPDNFLPEAISQRHAYSYIPFSAGPRSCIGTRYAVNVLKICTIYMMKYYRIRTKLKMEDLKFRMNITLNLMNTHLVTLSKRTSDL